MRTTASAGATMAESKEAVVSAGDAHREGEGTACSPNAASSDLARPCLPICTWPLCRISRRPLLDTKITAIAYETIEARGRHIADAHADERDRRTDVGARSARAIWRRRKEGRGCSWPVCRAWSLEWSWCLGAGVVGSAATRIAVGMGAQVTVINLDLERLRVPG